MIRSDAEYRKELAQGLGTRLAKRLLDEACEVANVFIRDVNAPNPGLCEKTGGLVDVVGARVVKTFAWSHG